MRGKTYGPIETGTAAACNARFLSRQTGAIATKLALPPSLSRVGCTVRMASSSYRRARLAEPSCHRPAVALQPKYGTEHATLGACGPKKS